MPIAPDLSVGRGLKLADAPRPAPRRHIAPDLSVGRGLKRGKTVLRRCRVE